MPQVQPPVFSPTVPVSSPEELDDLQLSHVVGGSGPVGGWRSESLVSGPVGGW